MASPDHDQILQNLTHTTLCSRSPRAASVPLLVNSFARESVIRATGGAVLSAPVHSQNSLLTASLGADAVNAEPRSNQKKRTEVGLAITPVVWSYRPTNFRKSRPRYFVAP